MEQTLPYSDAPSNHVQQEFHGSPILAGEPSFLSESASLTEPASSNRQESKFEKHDLIPIAEQQMPGPRGFLAGTRNKPEAKLSISLQVTGTGLDSGAKIMAWANQLEALFEAMSDGLSIFDQKGRLLYANSAARKNFPFITWSEYLSRPLSEHAQLLDARDAAGASLPQERWPLPRLLRGEQIPRTQAETVLLHPPDAREHLLCLSGAPLYDAEDTIVGAVLICQDMSAIKETEQLKSKIEAMKEAEQLKDNFIAAAAHELRSPLTGLMGYAEMLHQQAVRSKGSELAEWQIEALETITHDTMRIVGLTNDLLDVTRLHAGQLPLHRYNTNLVALTRRVMTRLRDTTKQHMLVVKSSAPRIAAYLDVQRIEQIVTNLLNNAIKYSPHGGEVLLSIQEDAKTGMAVLSVRDHGIGIPVSQQGQIFQRFFRATNATRLGLEGSGLGLYLSRELIQLHGGHIWFESVEGQGSTFYISLPLAPG
jgi:signal transduction histidine kinase